MADLIRFRDDEGVDHPAVTVDSFLDQPDAEAVRIEPGDDARDLIPHLAHIRLVEVNFPVFGDGRGYSAARILREAGYQGELRAVGDVLADQLNNMRRCGFDSFEPDRAIAPQAIEDALERWPHDYQPAVDGSLPIWKLRHG
ncbi:MAG: DUF934 domain-containing protein [Sphingomonadaceae bacterium]